MFRKFIYGVITLFVLLFIIGMFMPEPVQEQTGQEQTAEEQPTKKADTHHELVNSVATNVDTSWQYYFVEPIQRLANGEDIETVKADLELLVDLLEGEKKKLTALEGDKKVEQMRDELTKAIDKRIEAVKIMLDLEDHQDVEKVEGIIAESNAHLSKAASLFRELNPAE